MRRWFRARLRARVKDRAAMPRFFVIVDWSMFRGGWRFFAARGMQEARAKCKAWVRSHPCGQASITDPEGFRSYWSKNWESLR